MNQWFQVRKSTIAWRFLFSVNMNLLSNFFSLLLKILMLIWNSGSLDFFGFIETLRFVQIIPVIFVRNQCFDCFRQIFNLQRKSYFSLDDSHQNNIDLISNCLKVHSLNQTHKTSHVWKLKIIKRHLNHLDYSTCLWKRCHQNISKAHLVFSYLVVFKYDS